MLHIIQFVQHLDHLLHLCGSSPDELATYTDNSSSPVLAAAARAAALTHVGELTVVLTPTGISCNGLDLGTVEVRVEGLIARMREAGVERLFVARDASHTDILAFARALAAPPAGQSGEVVPALRTVRVLMGIDGGSVRSTGSPELSWTTPDHRQLHPLEFSLLQPVPMSSMTDMVPEQVVGVADHVHPSWRQHTPMINTPVLLRAIDPSPMQGRSLDALIVGMAAVAELPEAQRASRLAPLTDELERRAESALRDGDGQAIRDILLTVLRAAGQEASADTRLILHMTRRRLLAPPFLRAIARMVPRHPEGRDDLLSALAAAGEPGADILIEQLTDAASPSDRRAYFSALLQLNAGVPSLLQMLDDQRWFVVRNAVDLLGEMRVARAEGRLLALRMHGDERVRRSVIAALGALGTKRALHAVQESLNAPEPELRSHAAAVLAGTNWPYTVTALRRRLREERDGGVELALVAALGRVGSGEAVALLTELAAPPRLPLLGRRQAPLRAAAAAALEAARGDRAVP